MFRQMALAAALTMSSVGTGVVMLSSPAQADSQLGCRYPRVCFYLTEDDADSYTPTASYRDVTSNWQTLGAGSRGAVMINNTRNDDIAYIHFTNGHVECMTPREVLNSKYFGTADKIRISSASSC